MFSESAKNGRTDRPPPRATFPAIRPALELGTVFGLVLIELWYLRGTQHLASRLAVYSAIGVVCALSRRRRGWIRPVEPTGGGRAWAECGVVTAAIALVVVIVAWLFRDGEEGFRCYWPRVELWPLAAWVAGRFAGAAVQEVLLQRFVWPVSHELTGVRACGVFLAASVFALAHLPHPILVAFTALAGLAWCGLYARSRRLFPLIVSHLVLSVLAHCMLPRTVLPSMDIGRSATIEMFRVERLDGESRRMLKRIKSRGYYAQHGGTPAGWAQAMFEDLFGRSPTAQELRRTVAMVRQQPREQVAARMVANRRFRRVREGEARYVAHDTSLRSAHSPSEM